MAEQGPDLLPILSCPECGCRFTSAGDGLRCGAGHQYAINPQGIPLFAPPDASTGDAQRGEAEELAAGYAGLRAFAAEAVGRGESEGLYRTVSDLLARAVRGQPVRSLLDLGCGAGRTLVDCATRCPEALVCGLDRSEAALTVAYGIARLRGDAVALDLQRWGYGRRRLRGRGLRNVALVQAAAERLPFAIGDGWPGFDAVTCVNLLDRAENPEAVLAGAAAVLRPGGCLLLTTPLNWRPGHEQRWQVHGSIAGLQALVAAVGLEVELAFDGLLYRELQDVRGSALDWRVAVLQARRT